MSRVIHISKKDCGGAGLAALRIHQQFIQHNIQSTLLVNEKTADNKNVFSISKYRFLKRVANYFYRNFNIVAKVRNLFIDQKYLFFSLGNKNNKKASGWIRKFITGDTEVIFIHWIAGWVSLSDIAEAIDGRNIKVYVNLCDMAHFTGGCHFSFGCSQFEKQCFNCPATVSTNLSKKIRQNIKVNSLALIKMNASAISFSKFTLEQARRSSVPFSNYLFVKQPIDYDNFFYQANSNIGNINISSQRKKILMGSYNVLDERKGYITFMLAINFLSKLLEKENLMVEILVPKGTKCEELKSKNIDLIYYDFAKNDKQLNELYLLSDLFVNTSIDDTAPLMLAESLFSGIPVIATNTGCAPELLKYDSKLGVLIDNMDSQSIALNIYNLFFSKSTNIVKGKHIEISSKQFYKSAISYIDLL